MYKSFEVNNFRCFGEFSITDIERVNLISGRNNVGKTALLEALFLHGGAYKPELTVRVNAFRGIDVLKLESGWWSGSPFVSIFRDFDASKIVKLVGENHKTGHRALRLKMVREPKELEEISRYIQLDLKLDHEDNEARSYSLEADKVLLLEYEELEEKGRYYLILGEKGMRTVPIPPSPPFQTFFQITRMRIPPGEEAERFGNLQKRREESVVYQVLKLIEPRLRNVGMIYEAGVPYLHGDIEGVSRPIPLPLMGEGMTRLASMVINIGNAQNGVVLIDEIENGLHHSVLVNVWQAIGEAARRFNTQVFATTHSRECVVAAHKAFTESDVYDFRMHRLERVDEIIRAVTYDEETLEAAIEAELEVR